MDQHPAAKAILQSTLCLQLKASSPHPHRPELVGLYAFPNISQILLAQLPTHPSQIWNEWRDAIDSASCIHRMHTLAQSLASPICELSDARRSSHPDFSLYTNCAVPWLSPIQGQSYAIQAFLWPTDMPQQCSDEGYNSSSSPDASSLFDQPIGSFIVSSWHLSYS